MRYYMIYGIFKIISLVIFGEEYILVYVLGRL